VVYTGKQFIDELNLAYVDAYTTLNFGGGVTRGRLSIQAYANNLLRKAGRQRPVT